MNKPLKIATFFLAAICLFTAGAAAEEVAKKIDATLRPDMTIIIDGKKQTFKDVNGNIVYPVYYGGTTYLPVRAIGNIMGKEVDWDGNTQTITLGSGTTLASPDKGHPSNIGVPQSAYVKNQGFSDYRATVTIIDVKRGTEIEGEYNYLQATTNAFEYMQVKVRIEISDFNDSIPFNVGNNVFSCFSSSDDEQYTQIFSSELDAPDFVVEANSITEGNLLFAVKKDDTAPFLVYGNHALKNECIWFALGR